MSKDMSPMVWRWYNDHSEAYIKKPNFLDNENPNYKYEDELTSLGVAASNNDRSKEYRVVAHIKISEILAKLGDNIAAEKSFREAAQINQYCSLLYSKMAKFYSDLGKMDPQKDLHENVIEVFNQNESIREADRAVYRIYFSKEEGDQCAEELDKVKGLSQIWKREYLVENGNFKELLDVLKFSYPVRLLDISDLFYNISNETNFSPADIETIKRCIKNGLSNNYLFHDIDKIIKAGDILFEIKEYQDAMVNYTKAAELTECMLSDFKPYIKSSELPPEVKIKLAKPFGRVANLYAVKDYESAIYYYSKAIEINPDCSEYHCGLGRVHYKMGNLREAETSLLEALRQDGASKEANYNIGRVFYEQGRYSKAFEHLTTAKESGIVAKNMENLLHESAIQAKKLSESAMKFEDVAFKMDEDLESHATKDFDKSIMGLDTLREEAGNKSYVLGSKIIDDYDPSEQISQSLPINVGRGREIKITPVSSPQRNSAPADLLAAGRGKGGGSWSDSISNLSGSLSDSVSWALGYRK